MKISNLAGAVALTSLLSFPVVADAATDRDALQACSEAIATTIEKKQEASVNLRVDESSIDPDARLVGTLTSFEVDARDTSTDNVIGRFRCQVDRRANVTRLRTLALNIPSAAR